MNRRKYIVTIGTIGLGVIAGCTGETETESPGTTSAGTTAETTAGTEMTTEQVSTTQAETEEPTTQESTTSAETESSTLQVKVSYEGEWSGTVGTGDSTRSVDGSGTETIDIESDSLIVSANAQKQDDSSRELTVQIIENGEVIAEQSTSAGYGVAQVTSEDGAGSGGSAGESTLEVRVQYSGEWQGSIGTGGSVRTVDGTGSKTIAVEGNPTAVSANAQKQDDGSGELIVQILKDGEVVKEASTTAEYGVAQVTYSNF